MRTGAEHEPPHSSSLLRFTAETGLGSANGRSKKNRKKPVDTTGFVSGNVKLHSAGDLTAAQAASADINMLGSSVHNGLDALHIRLPGTVGTSVRMADLYAKGHTLITKLTFCHKLKHLLACVS